MSASLSSRVEPQLVRRLAIARALPWPAYPLALWLLARLVIASWGVLAVALTPGADSVFETRSWPLQLFLRWDAHYFVQIAQQGYFGPDSAARWVAFFPGLPIAGRAVAELFTAGHASTTAIVAGLTVVSAVASAVAAMLLWRIVEARSGRRVALAATALLVAGPYSFVLLAPYSEALFLACALGAWWAASSRRWVLAGLCLAAASATRINGVFLIPAVAVLFVLACRSEARPCFARTLGLVVIGTTGVASYFTWLWLRTGNPFAWSAAQESGWHRRTNWPWFSFLNTVARVLGDSPPNALQYCLDLVFAAAIVAGLVVLLRRRAWPEAMLLGATAVCMMTSSSYMSIARASLLLFPLWVLVAGTVRSRHPWIFWIALLGGAALLLVNTHQFVLGYWAD